VTSTTALAAVAAEARRTAIPLEALLERFVTAIVSVILAHAGVIRAFIMQGVRDPLMRERVVAGLEGITALLAGLRGRPDVAHPDPDLAADLIVRTLTGALQQAILLDRPFPPERYAAELSRAAHGHLTGI
jgi:hypothetical protein